MKTVMLLAFALFITSYAQAYNTEYVNVSTDKTKLIDVANQASTVSLKWNLQSKNGFTVPKALVIKESGDFQCRISKTILLFSGYNQDTKLWNQTWEIKVEWSPGTDQSGCLVQMIHPDEGTSFAELYMNYNFTFRSQKKDTPDEGSGTCENYECENGNGRGSDYGDPDSTSDGPSRDSGGGVFDGGGYSGGDGGYSGI